MANRSYLYAVDSIPTDKTRPRIVRSLSEWSYDIPLTHLMLVSAKTQLSYSIIEESSDKLALLGDFNEGLSNLIKLLRFIQANTQKDTNELVNEIKNAVTFILSTPPDCKYILLEPIEILDLDGDISEGAVTELASKSQTYLKAIEEGNTYPLHNYAKGDVIADWKEHLGLFWSDILYFQFDDLPGEAKIFDITNTQAIPKQKIFFIPRLQYIDETGTIRKVAYIDEHTGREAENVWAGKINPHEPVQEGVARELENTLRYKGGFTLANASKVDTIPDKKGNMVDRYSIDITLDSPFTEGVTVFGYKVITKA